jgi:hypothetical protein
LDYERVLDSNLSFSLCGLRHRLPEAERPYWGEYIGTPITIDDKHKAGILLIQPRRALNLRNLYAIGVVRGGYAWLQNVYERVQRAEEKFYEEYCKAKGWDRNTLTLEQSIEITEQEGFTRAGEFAKDRRNIPRR